MHLSRDVVDYNNQAAFRHALREFLRFSEEITGAFGTTHQQYQTMLAIKTAASEPITIGALADALLLHQHSVTTLIDRLEAQGLALRRANPDDRRKTYVALTPRGEEVLYDLVVRHQAELRRLGSRLLDPLLRIVGCPEITPPVESSFQAAPSTVQDG